MHFQQRAKAGRFLAAAIAELQTDFLVFLWRHGFEQGELLNQEAHSDVNTLEERDYSIRIFLLQVIVNIEKRIANQLHPELFDLMDELELQFIRVAKSLEIFLAGKERFGVQVDFVIERSFTVHDGIKMLAIHRTPSFSNAPLLRRVEIAAAIASKFPGGGNDDTREVSHWRRRLCRVHPRRAPDLFPAPWRTVRRQPDPYRLDCRRIRNW